MHLTYLSLACLWAWFVSFLWCRLLSQNATKFLLDDVYRNPGPLQFDGPGADAKAVTLCVEDQDYMGRIKKLQEYLDKVLIFQPEYLFLRKNIASFIYHAQPLSKLVYTFFFFDFGMLHIYHFIFYYFPGSYNCEAWLLARCPESSIECHGFCHGHSFRDVLTFNCEHAILDENPS